MKDRRPAINDFATRSFRDPADQDYIMARIAYRKQFDQQFRWCALQALEKYFKAILLYNSVSTKNLGHNLVRALNRVREIVDLGFELPATDTEHFIKYISEYGSDRYFSYPTYLIDKALPTLDKTIWSVRRHCFFMRQTVKVDGIEKNLFEQNKQKTTDKYFEEQPHKYRILGGYLESVIDNRLPAYDDLVWKNFYYGKVKKHQVNNFPCRVTNANPTHTMHPEAFNELSELVYFPK